MPAVNVVASQDQLVIISVRRSRLALAKTVPLRGERASRSATDRFDFSNSRMRVKLPPLDLCGACESIDLSKLKLTHHALRG